MKGFPAYVRSQYQAFQRETLEGDFDNVFFYFAETRDLIMVFSHPSEEKCLILGIAKVEGKDSLTVFQLITTKGIFEVQSVANKEWRFLDDVSNKCGLSQHMKAIQEASLQKCAHEGLDELKEQIVQLEGKLAVLQNSMADIEEINENLRLLCETPRNDVIVEQKNETIDITTNNDQAVEGHAPESAKAVATKKHSSKKAPISKNTIPIS